MSKEQPTVLNSAEPITDGGRKYNIIYIVCGILFALIFMFSGINILLGILVGLIIGWLIKSEILLIASKALRRQKFQLDQKIPYSELINRLIPVLSQLGMEVEKEKEKRGGYPVILYKGIIYDVSYEENENTFTIWWRLNLVRAFLKFDQIGMYRKIVAAMGMIGYNVQRICAAPIENSADTAALDTESEESRYCTNCGNRLKADEVFCPNCGKKVQ